MSWDSYYKCNKSLISKKFYKSVEVQKKIFTRALLKKQTHNNKAVKLWHSMVTPDSVSQMLPVHLVSVNFRVQI